MFPLKPRFVEDFPLPCLITRAYISWILFRIGAEIRNQDYTRTGQVFKKLDADKAEKKVGAHWKMSLLGFNPSDSKVGCWGGASLPVAFTVLSWPSVTNHVWARRLPVRQSHTWTRSKDRSHELLTRSKQETSRNNALSKSSEGKKLKSTISDTFGWQFRA